jgi:hypothetical protein
VACTEIGLALVLATTRWRAAAGVIVVAAMAATLVETIAPGRVLGKCKCGGALVEMTPALRAFLQALGGLLAAGALLAHPRVGAPAERKHGLPWEPDGRSRASGA